MPKPNDPDFDFLADLKNMTEDLSPSVERSADESKASFQTEKMEDRVLFSATWADVDGEALDGATENDDVFTGTSGRDVASGGDGDDLLDGLEGNDVLYGGEGNDTITGGEGNDVLRGESGNDTFVYAQGDGNDRMLGGEGTDRVDATQADTLGLLHMTASDSIESIDGAETGTRIEGTAGNNHLNFANTELNNITEIDGGAGNDYIQGSQSNDVIIGGEGNDRLFGNDGHDTFVVGEGDGFDRFNGGEGVDRVDATQTNSLGLQHLTVNDSIENIDGSAKGTRIVGTDGNNHLNFSNTELNNISEIDAGAGNDRVYGSQADDVIVGGAGDDVLRGNAGNDTFVVNEGDGTDRILGGEGEDRIDATQTNSLGLRHMVAADSVERIDGSAEGTRIEGNEKNNHLNFSDVQLNNITEIDAGAGNDYVKGSQDDDVIIGGEGNDRLYGNEGDDTFVYSEGDGHDRMNGGEGFDSVDASNASTLQLQHVTAGDSIEAIQGSAEGTRIESNDGNNHLNFSNVELTNISEIDAGGGNDNVRGSQGDDVIVGGEGNDTLRGNAGNDTFVVGEGDGIDRMLGGEGQDRIDATQTSSLGLKHMVASDSIETIDGSSEGTRIEGNSANNHLNFSNVELNNISEIDAGAGSDYVRGSQGDDVIIGGEGNDRLYGNGGNDLFVYTEGDGNDRMNGGEGFDSVDATGASTLGFTHLTAGDSIESIEGSAEGTRIEGTDSRNHLNFSNTSLDNITEIDAGGGNDYVQGSQSDDVIIGGEGNDRLYGNGGNDTFVYAEGDGFDRFRGGDGVDAIDATEASTLGFSHLTAGDSVESIEGSEEGTRIEGTDGRNHLNFKNTELTNITEIDAGGGNDYVQGSQSDDVIIGGEGNDRLYGNGGNDTFIYTEGDGADRFQGGDGTDRVDATEADSLVVSHMTRGDSIEVVDGSSDGTRIEGTDVRNHMDFMNTELNNVTEIDAGGGNDFVRGSVNDDVIIGGEGDDRLYGHDGDDTFVVNANEGTDRFVGGSGHDTIDATNTDTLGIQRLTSGYSIETINGSEEGTRIEATDGNDHLNFSRTELNNITEIDAGAGDDVVYGTTGDDVFVAGEGNDRFVGNGGNDVVVFDGNRADYEITNLGNGLFEVQDLREGEDGRDVINRMESFEFADGQADVGTEVSFTADSLQLSGGSVVENSETGTVVASFGANESFSQSHTYAIVDAEGNAIQHSDFEIVDNQLVVKAGADLNFESAESVELRIQSTSPDGVQYTSDLVVDVTDTNDAPTANSFSMNVLEDEGLDGNLLDGSNDEDGDTLSIIGHSQPENGSVIVHDNGTFTYQPNPNFSGTDSFEYAVSDGSGEMVTETVTIEVEAVADGIDVDLPDVISVQEHEILSIDSVFDIDLNAAMIDADGSENISQVLIQGFPTSAELSAGTQLEDGSWVLNANDLEGLEVRLDGFGNDDFELTIEVTTQDGDDTLVQTKTLAVEVGNSILNTRIAQEVSEASSFEPVSNVEISRSSFEESNDPRTSIAKEVFSQVAGQAFEFGSSVVEQGDVWNSDAWPEFSEAGSSSSADFSTEVAEVDTPDVNEMGEFDQELTEELMDLEHLEPAELVASEVMTFDAEQLANEAIEIDGMDWLPTDGGSAGTENLTAASLLMLFTKREDKRRKLKPVGKSENETNQGVGS